MMRLYGKKILITGATSGIGFASLKRCIEEGAFAVFTARNAKKVNQTQQLFPKQCLGFVHDSSDFSKLESLADFLIQHHIELDAVFLNAGNVLHASFGQWTENMFDQVFDTNIKAPFLLLQTLKNRLNPHCSVVLCGSTSIHIALEQSSVYAASKIALRSLVKTLSRELLNEKIRFNLLSPGPTATAALDKVSTSEQERQALKTQIQNLVPIGRLAEATEIADAFIYLASDESRFVIGTELLIDGGVANL
ncbi:SDR family oxidoreductase [Acinetobacter gerneri]|uniref:SDR family oxidoreductase n=1 Tax=Acinetobacter gerneri TaxID=202952 RepID=UPI003A86B65B